MHADGFGAMSKRLLVAYTTTDYPLPFLWNTGFLALYIRFVVTENCQKK
jgi:hypothetical protein